MIDELIAARTEHNIQRARVESWVDGQTKHGMLVQYSSAPAWRDYETANARWTAAVLALDAHIAGLKAAS